MTEQIDLENLFSDPKNMPEFIPDYSIDEIDEALNQALADINSNHPNFEETNSHNNNNNNDVQFHDILNNNDELKNKNPIVKTEIINTTISSKINYEKNFENLTKNNNIKETKSRLDDCIEMKPLSPESLLSDTSLMNSPKLQSQDQQDHQPQSQDQQDQQLINENINLIKTKILNTNETIISYEIVKKAYLQKCNELEFILKELEKSEIKKIKLMEENKHLKKVVTSLTMNE